MWRAQHVCVDGVDFTFAWFPPPGSNASAPSIDIAVFAGGIGANGQPPQFALWRGSYDVPADPLLVNLAEPVEAAGLEHLFWRHHKQGLFDYHLTRRFGFRVGVQLPVGSDLTVAWRWTGSDPTKWWLGTTETVQPCAISWVPLPIT